MIEIPNAERGKLIVRFADKKSIERKDRVLLNYLRNFVNIEILKPSSNYAIGNLKFKTSIVYKYIGNFDNG